MARATKRERSRLEDYLDDLNDSPLPAHLAARSRLPKTHGCSLKSNDQPICCSGTSMLLQNSNATSYNSLPGLTSAPTEDNASSTATLEGKRHLDSRLKLMDIITGGISVLPRARPVLLECPFNFLSCYERFESYASWHRHSLTHFSGVEPPHRNKCCFCDAKFSAGTGEESWQQRLEHVAMHHRLGHSLAHARIDFDLYKYLWGKQLVSTADLVSGSRGYCPVLTACL